MGFKPSIPSSKAHKERKIPLFTFENSNEKQKTQHEKLAWDSHPFAIDNSLKEK